MNIAKAVNEWFVANRRDLPWRRVGFGAWGILVSEIMLQQTPVARVIPRLEEWLQRWPDPAALAAVPSGEAVRAWNRLGYPRRALYLHAAAVAITGRHGGVVPRDVDELLALPGIGDYTARAVAVFALRQRHPVVDTNVRRVVARVVEGVADAAVTRKDLALVEALLPADDETAAALSIALMELGALVCTARAPKCGTCPVANQCAWLAAGSPGLDAPVKRQQGYAGTDRQVRGRLLAVLRDSESPVRAGRLDQVWDEPLQRDRALATLVADGLVDPLGDGTYALPSRRRRPPFPVTARVGPASLL